MASALVFPDIAQAEKSTADNNARMIFLFIRCDFFRLKSLMMQRNSTNLLKTNFSTQLEPYNEKISKYEPLF